MSTDVSCTKCGGRGGAHTKSCPTGKSYCRMSIGAFLDAKDKVRETGEHQLIPGSSGWTVRPVKETGDV